MSRILLLASVVDREFKRMVERRGVFRVRLGGEVIPESTIQSLLNLVYLAFVVNFVSCMALAAMGSRCVHVDRGRGGVDVQCRSGIGQRGPGGKLRSPAAGCQMGAVLLHGLPAAWSSTPCW